MQIPWYNTIILVAFFDISQQQHNTGEKFLFGAGVARIGVEICPMRKANQALDIFNPYDISSGLTSHGLRLLVMDTSHFHMEFLFTFCLVLDTQTF
jgi:hypothetical protein